MNGRSNRSYNLNYIRQNEASFAILFIHGNGVSSQTFVNQFPAKELKEYTLFAVDLPGHGDSQRAENPTEVYSLKAMGKIVAEFIKKNISQPLVIVGSSLGGNIAIEAAPELENVKGLFLCGTAPLSSPADLASAFLPHPANALSFKEEHTEEELVEVCKLSVGNFEKYYQSVKDDIKRSDKNFRSTLFSSIIDGSFGDEKNILRNLNIPVALIHAENEIVVNLDYLKNLEISDLWRDEIQIIPDAPHFMHLTHPEIFNKLLDDFIREKCN